MSVLDRLLDSDAGIRWQVLRDLVHSPAEVVAAERQRMAHRGLGGQTIDMYSMYSLVQRGALRCFSVNDGAVNLRVLHGRELSNS